MMTTQKNERNCVTCKHSKDGHCAGTEVCHLCMWENQYKPKVGHWIMTNDYFAGAYGNIDYVECSCCHEYSLEEGNFCPNCGTKMVES